MINWDFKIGSKTIGEWFNPWGAATFREVMFCWLCVIAMFVLFALFVEIPVIDWWLGC